MTEKSTLLLETEPADSQLQETAVPEAENSEEQLPSEEEAAPDDPAAGTNYTEGVFDGEIYENEYADIRAAIPEDMINGGNVGQMRAAFSVSEYRAGRRKRCVLH